MAGKRFLYTNYFYSLDEYNDNNINRFLTLYISLILILHDLCVLSHLLAVPIHCHIVFMCDPISSVLYLYFLVFILNYTLYLNVMSVYILHLHLYSHCHLYSGVSYISCIIFCIIHHCFEIVCHCSVLTCSMSCGL